MLALSSEAPVLFQRYPEHPNNPFRLGRHQVHDALLPEREAFGLVDRFLPIKTVTHREYEPVWDQGSVGSCTANAALGCLATDPFGADDASYTEDDALALYELETRIDDRQVPGHYPPDDTGSSGPWSMMALERQGKIRSWVHTRATHTALRLIKHGPISLGIPWFQSMFQVDTDGIIQVDETSGIAGGHQVCVTRNDAQKQRIYIRNSWGPDWGIDAGHAWLSWADLDFLLHEGGDAVQPVK